MTTPAPVVGERIEAVAAALGRAQKTARWRASTWRG